MSSNNRNMSDTIIYDHSFEPTLMCPTPTYFALILTHVVLLPKSSTYAGSF